ncbi:MAG: hypothetical protein QM669_12420 [Siphonobacter sp.]
MLLQRDNYISFEPSRIVTYRKQARYNHTELTESEMLKLVTEGIAGNEDLAGERIKRENDLRDDNLIRNNLYNGWLNEAAARSMRGILMNWTQAIELHSNKNAVTAQRIYPILLTLTLPGTQFVSDYDVKLALEKFLSHLNRKEDSRYEAEKREIMRGVKHKDVRNRELAEALSVHQRALRKYLWRAEPQKNGNIHFHLVLDEWIDKDEVRKRWNEALEDVCGAISLYQYAQLHHYRMRHVVAGNPETVHATSVTDWKPGKPFIYRNLCFRFDTEAKKTKLISLRERLSKAIQLQKMPLMMEEGEVLTQLFRVAIRTKRRPSEAKLNAAVDELQVRAWCKAVDNEFTDPPTTRIESMRDKASVAAYLAKYLAKPTVKVKKEKVDREGLAVERPDQYKWILNGEMLVAQYFTEIPAETVTVLTEGRRLHGRIWGKSQALLAIKDFGFFKLTYDSVTVFFGMVDVGEEKVVKNKKESIKRLDLFGNEYYEEITKPQTSVRTITDYKKAMGERLIKSAQLYYERVKEMLGMDSYWQDTEDGTAPNITIIRLHQKLLKKQRTSGRFEKPTIITWSQRQLMQKFSPELETAYHAHYSDLFYTIYNSAVHVEAGKEPPRDAFDTDRRFRTMPPVETRVNAA